MGNNAETTTNTIPQVRGPKQVIVMRTDLGMRKGKMMAQAAHASMMFLRELIELEDDEGRVYSHIAEYTPEQAEWLRGEYAKIVVGVGSEDEMAEILLVAWNRGLTAYEVIDNGHTEFNGVKTKTCICIGPHHPDVFVGLTNHLKLL